MYIARLARLSLVCAAASVGCTDSGSVTAPARTDAEHNSASPLSLRSGATIDRNSSVAALFGGGPPTNLVVSAGNATVCPFSPGSPAPTITIQTPSGKFPAHRVTQEANVEVFEYSAGLITDACDLVGAPLVATGTAFFTLTTNQVTGPGTGPGSFVNHVTIHGVVDLVGGGQARLQARLQVVVRPDGTVVIDQEPVTLTPL